jgi:hypothetical protein
MRIARIDHRVDILRHACNIFGYLPLLTGLMVAVAPNNSPFSLVRGPLRGSWVGYHSFNTSVALSVQFSLATHLYPDYPLYHVWRFVERNTY